MTDEAATFWGNAKAEQSQQHALTVLQTEDTAPDQAAEHQRLAKRAGVPVGVVASDSSGVRRQVARDELGSLAQSAPALATWATAPENYAVAKDDLGPMERMAHALVRPLDLNRAAGAGLVRTIGSTIKGAADLEGALSRRR